MAGQKELRVVIDEWADAISALAEHAPLHARQAVHAATGDLLEAFGTSATNMASGALKIVLRKLEALSTITDALTEDTRAKNMRLSTAERKLHRAEVTGEKLQAQIDTLAERIDNPDVNLLKDTPHDT